MLEVTNVFTVLAWLLLCGNIVVLGGAALLEFGKSDQPEVGADRDTGLKSSRRSDSYGELTTKSGS